VLDQTKTAQYTPGLINTFDFNSAKILFWCRFDCINWKLMIHFAYD